MTKVVGMVPEELRALVKAADEARSDLDIKHSKAHALRDELQAAHSALRYQVELLFSELGKKVPIVQFGRDGKFQVDPDTFEISYLPGCDPCENEDLH